MTHAHHVAADPVVAHEHVGPAAQHGERAAVVVGVAHGVDHVPLRLGEDQSVRGAAHAEGGPPGEGFAGADHAVMARRRSVRKSWAVMGARVGRSAVTVPGHGASRHSGRGWVKKGME